MGHMIKAVGLDRAIGELYIYRIVQSFCGINFLQNLQAELIHENIIMNILLFGSLVFNVYLIGE